MDHNRNSLSPIFSLTGNNLSFFRNDQVIFRNISFDISQEKLLFVTGQNGAGKTSLLKIITGLQRDYTGSILFNKQPIHSLQEAYRSIFLYLGHQTAITKNQSVLENLQFYMNLSPKNSINAPKSFIKTQLQKLKLDHLGEILCSQLSAGQLRRVALTRLFISNEINQHRLWILDEPFVSLDHKGFETLQNLMEDFIKKGNSIILTSHQHVNVDAPTYTLDLPEGEFTRV